MIDTQLLYHIRGVWKHQSTGCTVDRELLGQKISLRCWFSDREL